MRRWEQTNGLQQREVLGRFLKKEVKGMNRLNKIVAAVMALALLVTGAGYVVKAVRTNTRLSNVHGSREHICLSPSLPSSPPRKLKTGSDQL